MDIPKFIGSGIRMPTQDEVKRCSERIASSVDRTPLTNLGTHVVQLSSERFRSSSSSCDPHCASEDSATCNSESCELEIYLKQENKQRCGSLKTRAAASYVTNLVETDGVESLSRGIVTASTGNFGQSLATEAQKRNIKCAVLVPDFTSPYHRMKLELAGADPVVDVPFLEWWQCVEMRRVIDDVTKAHPTLELADMHFVSQVSTDCIAGDATVGMEILDDAKHIDAIVVPYGMGSLCCGTSVIARQRSPSTRIVAVEVSTSSPFRNALKAGKPYRCTHTPSFASQIGGQTTLPTVWDQVNAENGLVADSAVVTLEQVADAMRLLKRKHDIVTEGSGAASLAAALSGQAGKGKVVCVISGGNVEQNMLSEIMNGDVPDPGMPIAPAPLWEPSAESLANLEATSASKAKNRSKSPRSTDNAKATHPVVTKDTTSDS